MCYRNCCAVFRACCRNWEGSAHRCPSPVSPSCTGAVWQLLQTLMIFSISVVVSLVGAPTHPPTALWEASATPALIRGWGRPAAHGSSVFGRRKQNYRDLSLIWRCSTSWSQPLASYEGSEQAAMCCGAEGSAGVTPAGRWRAAGVSAVTRSPEELSWSVSMKGCWRWAGRSPVLHPAVLCQKRRQDLPAVKPFSRVLGLIYFSLGVGGFLVVLVFVFFFQTGSYLKKKKKKE